jgi:hypothetical protein
MKQLPLMPQLHKHFNVGGNFMNTLLSIIFLTVCTTSIGQTKTFNGVLSSTGDTIFWYKYQLQTLKKLSLAALDTSKDKQHYRVWTNNQVIDLWENDTGISGTLITWTNEYIREKESHTNRTFVKIKKLTNDTTELVRQYFLSSGILNLPTQDSIKGWQQGLDGITYLTEFSTPNYYAFKTYWTPKVQKLKEAIQVQQFIDNIFLLLNAQEVWKSFAKEIPYECYFNGGPGVACKVLTKKESKKYFRERKNYRQHSIAKSGTEE